MRNVIKSVDPLFRRWERYFLTLAGSNVVGLRIIGLPDSVDPLTPKTTIVVKLANGTGLAKTWDGFSTEKEAWDTIERWVQALR